MSDVFGNPAYVGGQAQNLTGDIIPPGGTLGWSSGSAASGSGNPAPTLNASGLTIPQLQLNAPNNGAASSSGASASSATGASGAGATVTSLINSYFVRAIIIILGFIFVAVGLSLFRQTPAPAQFNPLPSK